ncbi:YeeE/YedE thiosulfate transporter family protein [Acinetobacter soli]|uniref:YeeE/YedE family protein n=1 Tax=Acinetobacter soli TaxID=487316 RepID=UPI00258A5F5D|nr:YeeE/YedE thiosulfate transporter family protein [Acinetobacter soli]MDQ8997354.1 YeeE/YedE thiosulfate transporter family protein [Acinetobacter soli]
MHEVLLAFFGGTLLGLAVVGYLYVHGRIAGISGLIAQQFGSGLPTKSPAFWFLSGLILTSFVVGLFWQPEIQLNSHPLILIIAGLLVGFGTRLGSGCTSGHGICGLSRLSLRSIMATFTFMLTGFITVYVLRHIIGGF